MKESIIMDAFEWLWHNAPGVLLFAMILVAGIWLAVRIVKFSHRFEKTENLCLEIHNIQLPEIRAEIRNLKEVDIKELREEMNRKFDNVNREFGNVNGQLVEINMFMKKIDTYLFVTSNKYRSG